MLSEYVVYPTIAGFRIHKSEKVPVRVLSVLAQEIYFSVVGGYANTYSWLRNTSDTTVGLDSHKTGILSPLWPTPIVVRQKYGNKDKYLSSN